MARIGLNSGEVTPTPAVPPEPKNTCDSLLTKWYGELSDIKFTTTASYELDGLRGIFQDTSRLHSILSRLDTMIGNAQRLHRRLRTGLDSAVAGLEDEMDKKRVAAAAPLINKAFAFQERESTYRSEPAFIGKRIAIRELERQVLDVETFIKVAMAKYRHFDGARRDQNLMATLIRLGYSINETD